MATGHGFDISDRCPKMSRVITENLADQFVYVNYRKNDKMSDRADLGRGPGHPAGDWENW
jgi:hypothetical protein